MMTSTLSILEPPGACQVIVKYIAFLLKFREVVQFVQNGLASF